MILFQRRFEVAGDATKCIFSFYALNDGHTVQPLICEVWGGFALGATRYLNSLAQLRGDSIAEERSSCTWTTRSFVSYYGQLLSIAVNIGGAMEIERALGKSDA